MTDSRKPWEIYEEAARAVVLALRKHLGVEAVGGKEKLIGASGVAWEIDGSAVLDNKDGFLVIEVRQQTSTGQKQEAVAAIAFRISDLGGAGGIIVSPLPLQTGAQVLAAHQNIHHIKLTELSTAERYIAEFMGRTFYGFSEVAEVLISDSVEITVTRAGKVIYRGP